MSQDPQKQGGHRIQPVASRERQQQYTCVDCHTTGPFGLFNVIGQLDYCPERVDSMNGYLWFNADDASVARMRAADQWKRHADRCGFAIKDWTYDPEAPGICARFTWREQAYVLRFGEDPGRGMKVNDLRVELAEEKPEQAGA